MDGGASAIRAGGGGGGASSTGGGATVTSSTAIGGAGGNGVSNSITGLAVVYGGGGGGGAQSDTGTATAGAGGSGGGGHGGYATQINTYQAAANGTNGLGGGGGGGQRWASGNNAGGSGGSGVVILAYASASAPTLSSVSPSSSLSSGTTLTLSGANFVSGASVTIGGTAASSITVVSSSSITCSAPSLPAGSYYIQVTNPDSQVSGAFKVSYSSGTMMRSVIKRPVLVYSYSVSGNDSGSKAASETRKISDTQTGISSVQHSALASGVRLYVVNGIDGSVSIVNPQDGLVIATVPIGRALAELLPQTKKSTSQIVRAIP